MPVRLKGLCIFMQSCISRLLFYASFSCLVASLPRSDVEELVGVLKADVMPASLSLIKVFAKLMLINLAFGSRLKPMTEPRFKVMDHRSSSVTLRQGLASLMYFKIHKA